MKARYTAFALTAVLVVYFILLGERAVWLIQTGSAAAIGLGGAWIAVVNLRFGARVAKPARRLADEGTLPDGPNLPRRPSGRVDRDAADAWFDQRKTELDAAPGDWRRWYRLADAYDLAGDRRRARDTTRHALRLVDQSQV